MDIASGPPAMRVYNALGHLAGATFIHSTPCVMYDAIHSHEIEYRQSPAYRKYCRGCPSVCDAHATRVSAEHDAADPRQGYLSHT